MPTTAPGASTVPQPEGEETRPLEHEPIDDREKQELLLVHQSHTGDAAHELHEEKLAEQEPPAPAHEEGTTTRPLGQAWAAAPVDTQLPRPPHQLRQEYRMSKAGGRAMGGAGELGGCACAAVASASQAASRTRRLAALRTGRNY